MLLNFRQCDKNVDECFMHFNVCLLSLFNFQDIVNDLNVSANESTFLSFVCRIMKKECPKIY